MSDTVLPKKHYLLTINQDIRAICEPLIRYGIVYFNYARFFNDNSAYVLTNDSDSFYNHINNQFPIDQPAPKETHRKKFHYLPFLDVANVNYKHVIAYRDYFNLEHPIYFVEKYKNYTDLFVYCSMPNNHGILNFYLNNLDFLERFKFYFKDKAKKLIGKASKNKILIPKQMWSNYNENKLIAATASSKNLNLRHYILHVNDHEISITSRELEVIKNLASGCTMKEVAKLMNVSIRTVETYLNNAKYKFKMIKKSDLIKIIAENHLL